MIHRYIDADATIKRIQTEVFPAINMAKRIEKIINNMPTIEERKTGRWIWDEEGYHCSECFFHAYGDTLSCLDGTFKYCPHCGAKMDEVEE